MSIHNSFWPTIATVIPVIALAMASEYKRTDWVSLRPRRRRRLAVWRGLLVAALLWAETFALGRLLQSEDNSLMPGVVVIVVAVGAADVLAAPLSPLLRLALHDMKRSVLQADRELRLLEREARSIQRDYKKNIAKFRGHQLEFQMEASEGILATPSLAFHPDGTVRTGYRKNIPALINHDKIEGILNEWVDNIEARLDEVIRRREEQREQFEKVRREETEQVVAATNFRS